VRLINQHATVWIISQLATNLSASASELAIYEGRHGKFADRAGSLQACKGEVDVILENRQGKVVGIEVKAASTVGQDDFNGLRHLAQRLGDDFIVGLVMYTGQQTLSFGPRLRAMPVSAIWEVPTAP
jgi:predicted AAA+ superfamily ATPase